MTTQAKELASIARVAQEAAALIAAAVAAELPPEHRRTLDAAITAGARPFLVTRIDPRAPRLELWLREHEGAEHIVATIDPAGRATGSLRH
ncbi:hypothetical protein SAMN05421829_102329 [Aromatoleum tolulyticum]|uniref:Uncharacterized protein n=1 Tax=Aromatoleum tolulyticum TaxID=34027 RepID=A0A1N6Q3M8_9RHOO|nr:hypothetical protein [Aromatoleum tolulyticum]SIQ11188.1 hypothetical protein SAMN05421829_102329 [Aromatoleum tolulyticum]